MLFTLRIYNLCQEENEKYFYFSEKLFFRNGLTGLKSTARLISRGWERAARENSAPALNYFKFLLSF
jgi:hypothetical protein